MIDSFAWPARVVESLRYSILALLINYISTIQRRRTSSSLIIMPPADGIIKVEDEPYAAAYRTDATETLGAPRVKQGHLCCGGCGCDCCCDVRRASIVVDTINVCLNLLVLIAVTEIQVETSRITDDLVKSELGSFPYGVAVAWAVVSIICYGCGILGAIQYDISLVGVALLWYCADFLRALIQFNLGGLLIAAFFAYPHVFLVKEIRQGIMSRENYHNEMHSCCCV